MIGVVTMDEKEAMKKMTETFGDGRRLLAHQILMLSMSGQPCDVNFFKKKTSLEVKIDQKITLALMYGAGANKLQEMLNQISLSDGQTVGFGEIWLILPMPYNGFTDQQ